MLDRAGLGNKEVAARTGAAVETVSRWRSGAQAISDEALFVVIEMLRERGIAVTPGWIRYAELPPAPAGQSALAEVVAATARGPRGAQLERPDVPAPRPTKSHGEK